MTLVLLLMTIWQFYKLLNIMSVAGYELYLTNTHISTIKNEPLKEIQNIFTSIFTNGNKKYIAYLLIELAHWIILLTLLFTKAIAFAMIIVTFKFVISRILRANFSETTIALIIALESVVSIFGLISTILLFTWR